MRSALAAVVLVLLATMPGTRALGVGSVSLAVLDMPVTETFDGLADSTGTAHTALPPGWYLNESGTSARNNDAYAVDTGGSNTGDIFSYGAAGSSERALGTLRSGTLVPIIGAAFTNATTSTFTSLDVAYTGEQWRLGTSGRADRLDFQYSVDATSLTTGTWEDVNALDFPSPNTSASVGALDGNSNSTHLSATITGLALAPGATIWIRWTDFDATGADDGLAIDDVTVTPHGGDAGATLSIGDVSIFEGNSGSALATFTVTVAGDHDGITFDIATADGTATTGDNDYDARLESVALTPSDTTYGFAVTVNGDTTVEANDTFTVNLTNVTGALVARGTAIGTIINDDEPPPVLTDVVISQVYGGGGNAGATLTHDFIELFNAGPTTVSLAGWSVQYTSAAGTGTWQTTPLSGSIAPGGYYLIQQAVGAAGTTPLPAPDAVGTIAMAATAGKVALQTTVTPITGACPLINTADLVGFGATTCFEGFGATAATSNTTAALRKRGGCFDSDNNAVDFSVAAPTPRNSATPARSCTPVPMAIHDVQGSGATSPVAGEIVVTTGIVTGVKSNGFFLQAPNGEWDADPLTSEALFVFTQVAPAVMTGNEVSARGQVSEFFDLTQIESTLPGDIAVTAAVAAVPAPIALTTAILDPNGPFDQLERFEGMRVHAPGLVSVAPTNSFGETATVLPGVARPMREPGIPVVDPIPPDPTTGLVDCCIPIFDNNPERIVVDSDGLAGAPVFSVTSNVSIGAVTGPLDFTFGEYKLLPESVPAVGADIAPVAVPAPEADELTVAGFNIENFAGNETRRRKAALAIRALMQSPDVIGHIEILDVATLQGLADQVNADAIAGGEPNPGYQAFLIPAPQGGTQHVGFLVKTSRVQVDGVSQELAGQTFTNPSTGEQDLLHDRPPLVLYATFDPEGVNQPFIAVVNHLRSFIDIELVDGAGPRVRAKRTAQAEATAQLLQDLQTDHPGRPVISVGDYNAYQFNDGYTDPIAILKGMPTPDDQLVVDESPDLVNPNFINLTDTLPAGERYSFIFEGNPQALDHVLINTVAHGYSTRYAIARGNADFPSSPLFVNDATRPERSSDHDMPVAYFRFPPPVPPAPPTAFIRGQITINGGSLISGALQVMTAKNVTFNGAATLTGDLFIAGTPAVTVNGHPNYAGTIDGAGAAVPTGHRVIINSGASLGHVVRRTDAVALPIVNAPPASTGTRSVSLNQPGDSPGDFATIRDLTLNGNAGTRAVPPGTYRSFTANGSSAFVLGVAGATTPAVYNFESLTLNGSSTLQVAGPVIVTVKNGLALNGSAGAPEHPEWLTLRVSNGGVTLNGSVSLFGNVEAPNGAVIINGGTTVVGGLAADTLTINGNGRLTLKR